MRHLLISLGCAAIMLGAASSGAFAEQPATPTKPAVVYDAVVNSHGTLVRGRATGAKPIGSAGYEVDFKTDVRGCAFAASLGDIYGTNHIPSPGYAVVATRHGVEKGVYVATYDQYGTLTPRDFHLIVVC